MHSREDEKMTDRLDRDDDSYFPTVEWPSQQSTWRASSKSLVCRFAGSGVAELGEAAARFVEESDDRPLVFRLAGSGVLDSGETSSLVVREKRMKPLVHRPAVHGFLAVEETSPQVVRKTRTQPLVLRPAIPEITVLHDIAERKPTMRLQSTLPYRSRVTDESRDSRRRYKQSLRKWIERKRRREERERWSGSDSRESGRVGNSHHEIDLAIIERRILDSLLDYSHTVGKEENELKDFVGKEHTLEEWQGWGKMLVERADKKKKDWEEYREKRELMDYRGPKIDGLMKGKWSREHLLIRSIYYCLDKLDRVLEEAKECLRKTHCETKEVDSERAEQSVAGREKAQFVETYLRVCIDSDDDDPSAMRPAKRKHLPLRMKK
ncbi:hypothetical protein BCIN_06g06050 [Botrytis cinerea B05.10]|uniref:Uncharacterized protein n=2 Tax=Botryotinia fuckeliana TaxID=40559 RepID=A0A384JKY4_BOTFB|nr:hypothetical protein BCIN_06g06050 [Botrytis cinerea B05.10]ATZ51180.1 hypothetical protein BCIN_06g06050 [Botrytis cinerea B05.10]CCD57040.1 hypothetical protein BofuT4_P143020.1 [Botrytis cinerea T4]